MLKSLVIEIINVGNWIIFHLTSDECQVFFCKVVFGWF